MALGFSDAASLGEGKAQLELQAALQRAGTGNAGESATSAPAVSDARRIAGSSSSASRSRSTKAAS